MLGTLTTRHTRFCRRLGVEATGTDQIFPQLKRSLALLGVATLPLGPGTFIDTGNYTGRLADHFPEHTPANFFPVAVCAWIICTYTNVYRRDAPGCAVFNSRGPSQGFAIPFSVCALGNNSRHTKTLSETGV